ncbi:MAG: hypothetical protein KC442_08610 [Thermomicrobiales bacterium]|nr:hypothetical protein [Thermomicrobiales bacterium]MCB1907676.1 hypothetical protein [Rhodocyclaceae bacterium]
MSRMLTAKDNQPTAMNRRDPQTGGLVQVMPGRDEYAVPPQGTYGRFKLTGISDTFEMVSPKYGLQTKARLEFQILKVQDTESKYLEGRRFTGLYTWTVGQKSNLGALLGALRGQPIQPGENVNPDDFIDTEFVTTTTLAHSADGSKSYADVSAGSIATNKTVLSKWLTTPKQPELAPAGGGEEELDDPFAVDDSDL